MQLEYINSLRGNCEKLKAVMYINILGDGDRWIIYKVKVQSTKLVERNKALA